MRQMPIGRSFLAVIDAFKLMMDILRTIFVHGGTILALSLTRALSVSSSAMDKRSSSPCFHFFLHLDYIIVSFFVFLSQSCVMSGTAWNDLPSWCNALLSFAENDVQCGEEREKASIDPPLIQGGHQGVASHDEARVYRRVYIRR